MVGNDSGRIFLCDAAMPRVNRDLLVCVTGGGGFIGSHVLPLLRQRGVVLRVLKREGQPVFSDEVETCVGDLFDPGSLFAFLRGAHVLINLAQPSGALADRQFALGMKNLARAARDAGVRRVIHISTAMVVGVPPGNIVSEDTIGFPRTSYERQKLVAEQILHSELGSEVDLGILRPTAVFGAGGQNLLKLAETIVNGSQLKRRLLRFFHGRRRMHLVSVSDVARAVVFLAFLKRSLCGNVFLISSDDEPANQYQAVDAILGAAMGKPLPRLSLSMPSSILRIFLRLAGRSQANPRLIYNSSKLKSWGFLRENDFELQLKEFSELYMKKIIK